MEGNMSICGSRINQIKTTKQPIARKIVVSTCYFPNYLHYFDKGRWNESKSLTYINELIANIETFQMKITRFTSHPEKWVYRVYLDETIFNIEKIAQHLFPDNQIKDKKHTKKIWNGHLIYQKPLHNKTNNNLINELNSKITAIRNNIINAYDVLIFISKLFRKYIDMILESGDSRYDNIEIMTYSNPDLQIHLGTDNSKFISGLADTYGTLMRFHPCLDKDARAVIIRNCSHNLTPLDLIIQNYWLEALPALEYMEYVDTTYDFTADRDLPFRGEWYKTLYNDSSNTKQIRANKIRHFGYDRVMAGLISAKVNGSGYNTSGHYARVFDKLYGKMQESLSSGGSIFHLLEAETLYTYGIDEAVINFIFQDLRSGTYRHKDVKNPPGLANKTFALELINGSTRSGACYKCDKKKFEIQLDNVLGKLPSSKETKKTGKTKTNKSNDKLVSRCCLNDVYMRDNGFYNLDYKITDFFNMEHILASLRALPLYKLKINSWQVSKLTFSNVLEGIMFINKYNFALRDKSNIPGTIRRTKKKEDQLAMNGGISSSATNKIEESKPESKSQSKKVKKEVDRHLVLCNVRSKNLDKEVAKYLAGVKEAYSVENFYPILIYPHILNIFSYYPENKKYQKTISFNKMLDLVKDRHGFII